MRYTFLLLVFAVSTASLQGQDVRLDKGVVTFVTAQNVYLKFESTEFIQTGDTIFSNVNNKLEAALVVNNKSSVSCVCSRLKTGKTVKVNDEFTARVVIPVKTEKIEKAAAKSNKVGTREQVPGKPSPAITPRQDLNKPRQSIKGRISASSYSNLSSYDESHRMQYAFSFTGTHLGESRFSVDNYITFRHTLGEWNTVQTNLASALKVYALAVKYDFDSTGSITLGRKINPRIASMGAADGLQVEKGIKHFLAGAIVGSRPDFTDYRPNLNLFQYGVYFGHSAGRTQKYQQSTVAYLEQRNHGKIDRRFVYLQHNNDILGNLNLFASLEMDLYQNVNDTVQNNLSLTNLFFSLRYKVSKNLNISGSYDNRKNTIYYESYKSYIEKLIEDETRQGLRLSANYRVFKNVNWGINTSWRFQKSGINDSKNLNTYVTIGRIPFVNISTTVSANLLQTDYLGSKIFDIRLNREIVPRKVDGELTYRYVNYHYKNSEYAILQHVAGVNLSWRITKKLAFYVYYEGTMQDKYRMGHRFNTKLIQRF